MLLLSVYEYSFRSSSSSSDQSRNNRLTRAEEAEEGEDSLLGKFVCQTKTPGDKCAPSVPPSRSERLKRGRNRFSNLPVDDWCVNSI